MLSNKIMSHDESILSNPSGSSQAHLIKVLANVVETQKSVASQFSALFDRVEEARNETRRNVQALTDEIKRLELRSNTMFEKVTTQLMAQNENLSTCHAAERAQWRDQNDAQFAAHAAERAHWSAQNENMLTLLKSTLGSAPRQAPAQQMQAFNPAMFGISPQDQQLMDQYNQLTPQQVAAFQMQMRNLQQMQQQQVMMQQQQQRATPSTASIIPPMPPSSVSSIPSVTPAVPSPIVTVPQPAKVEQKPAAPTPVSSVPSTVAAPKPLFSFGSPSGTNTAPKPLFGGPTIAPPAAPFSFSARQSKVDVKEEAADDENDEDHVEEYEPNVEFTPVIPLPDMVETVTGEEAEKVILEDRCKLFRYTNGEWKERATGSLKILKNEKTGKSRVVVRRDQMVLVSRIDGFHAQVHKVAANFNLISGVKIAPMKNNPKAVVWICQDFSEDEVNGVKEQLSAKFASPEKAEYFMDMANEIVDSAPKTGSTPKKTEEKKSEEKKGAKVDIPKAEEKAEAPVGFGDKFKMAAGEWECTACYVRNPADAGECSCCGTANPSCERRDTDKPSNPFGKNVSIFNPAAASSSAAPKFSFGIGGGTTTTTPVAAAKTETKTSTPSASGFSFGGAASAAPAATTTAAPKFSFAQAAAAASKEDEKKPLFGSPAPSNAFGAGVTPSASASSFSFKTAAAATPTAATFSFKTPDPSKPASIFGGSSKTLFGTSNPVTPADGKKEEEKKDTPATIFGSTGFMTGGQSTSTGFGSLSGKPSIFDQQDKVAEGQKNFAALAKSKPFGQSAAVEKKNENDEEGEEGEPEEYEPDVEFAPVIPLPDLVEVKTGEEDEKVMFSCRSKIFRFVRETKEWKERGVGELKLLHNESSNKFRVVMRRDQVHKLCANFSVLKDAKLTEQGQSNVRSIIVTDFAENAAGDMETLSIKFKNAELAKEFENAFKDAQAKLQ